ncbi:MAG TPA: non-ribosomal peptide synthase/polyketide synthase [Thermoanaerobaculia bacterium]|jgi:amino acid adenylation domain-containing protein|nr:non-ribosomal peptide synthase/polyketide synthase [Thermoanaerobaculia bacterium]
MKSFPLTLAQQDIYFDQLHAAASPRYNIGGYIRFAELDPSRLQAAHARMVRSHDAFGVRIDGAAQFLAAERTTALPIVEFGSVEAADEWLRAEFRKLFVIEKEELFRAFLLKIAGVEWRYAVVAHHLMIDGWGFSNLARVVCSEVGEEQALPWHERSADDAAYAASERYEESRQHWTEHCKPLPEAALTPFHRSRFHGLVPSERETLVLSREEYARHAARAAEMGVSIAAYFMAHIARLAGRERIILGVPSHNRRTHAQKRQIGVALGINPLAIDVREADTLATLAARIQQTQRQNLRHARFPIGHTLRNLGQQRLHDIGFNYLQMKNEVEIHYLSHGHEPTPLSITLFENGDALPVEVQFDYRLDYFDASEAKLLVSRFAHLLATGELLSPADRAIAANAPDTAFPEGRIETLFEQHAARTPDAIALVAKERTLTYRELNERADALAKQLRAGELVAISCERSIEAIVGTLAVLKAGSAYLPLDPNYPESRRQYLLEDSGARRMITAHGVADLAGDSQVDPSVAYVMYTSGSTGQPKGVMVEHRGVVRLVVGNHYAPLQATTRMLQVSSYGFDAATFEIWGALLNGGTLVLYPESHLDLDVLNQQIDAHRIDTILLTAALFEQWSHQLPKNGTLRSVLSGGDVVSPGAVARVYAAMPDVTVINAYGPTENSVMACCYTVPREGDFGRAIPLGKKINGTSLHVLGNNLQPLPAGAVGELLVGGPGVARGYWNRPELTAEKFVTIDGERLYRTGDLVRYLPDGNLTFIGRADQQVKVRGFRIEPGEIEAQLLRVYGVREAAVVVRGEGADKTLAAYWVGETDPRAELATLLPAHMIPSAFVRMDALPLNASGKVDRKALPDVGISAAHDFVAPSTATERRIAAVWQDVLKLDQVSVTASFFDLGGHSLLAARVANLMGGALPVRAIFEQKTIRALAAWLDAQPSTTDAPIPRVSREEQLPLSFAQQRLWFLDQLEGGSAQYNIPFALRLTGELRLHALQHAFDEIVRRHEVLRTTYHDGVQVIHPATPLEIERVDAPPAETPFDLAHDRMLRVQLLTLGEQEHLLFVTLHHIAADGWSIGLLVRELAALYEGQDLPELPTQYADYAAWHRARMQGQTLETQLAYWKSQLAGAPAVHGLPLDHPRPARQQFAGRTLRTRLGRSLLAALNELAARHDATLFMVLQTAFSLLVSRWSGTPDVVIGTPVAGRQHRDVESLIGFFVNTLVLRTEVADEQPFLDLLRKNRERALDAFSHQDVPFEMLVDALNPERSLSHTPLFQLLFVLQNNERFSLQLPGLEIAHERGEHEPAKFDLQLSVHETEEGLDCEWTYAAALFDARTIERLASSFEVLTHAIAAAPETASGKLAILTADEARTILAREGVTRDYDYRTIHELFEEQVALDPSATALVFEGEQLTYGELNARANQLAHYLRGRGVGREVLVGISMERSFELLIGLLGILKAGGAYVPLDPTYPHDRLDAMREDSGVAIVVTPELFAGIGAYSRENLGVTSRLGDLAYMIYTSGSTGKPKGALNEHRAVVNRLLWMREHFSIRKGDRFLQKTPFSFDVSVWELFNALISGATLVIARPEGHRDGDYLARLIADERITLVHFVPSMLSAFLRTPHLDRLTTVERVICSGEALPPELVKEFFTHFRCELHNLYGPTEAAIEVTHWQCKPEHEEIITPLGHPVANTRMYVLDAHLRPLPDGVTGELYIGGVQVGRGYHGRPELTAERFLRSPHRAGERLYRTGDLARYRTDGLLEFLGRMDDQVKIRGFRIELGEIKARLLEQPGVKEALVLAREQRLIAYIVPQEPLLLDDLKDALKRQLPEYMVPAAFVLMDAFPVTANGKVDKRALPEPERIAVTYVAPADRTEARLAALWQEILQLEEPVSVTANFFDLGGHSLLATRIVSAISHAFEKAVPVRALFEHNTVRTLAAYLAEQGVTAYRAIPAVPREGALPLSFAQQRLWFLDQLEEGSAQYNMPAALRLRGALDREALQRAFDALVGRHEVLRTRFVDGAQVIDEPAPVHIRTLRGSPETLAREEALRPFDLRRDPMLRVTLIELGRDEHALLVTLHHIAADGWSVDVMIREIAALYGGGTLPALPIQYADYAAWHREQLQGAGYERQLAYWKARLADMPRVHALPLDRPRPAKFDPAGASLVHALDASLVEQLRSLAQAHNASLFMLLQSAFALLIARWSRSEDVVIGTPIAGREHRALDPLIGFFVNTLVLRTRIDGGQTFAEFLAAARQTALDAYANQTVPFETLVDELKPERSLSHAALFQLMFSLSPVGQTPSLPGLEVELLPADARLTKFDLNLTAFEGSEPHLQWDYATSLFDAATIERLSDSFVTLLRGIAAAPSARIDALPIASAVQPDRGALVAVPEQLVHELFEEHAARTPEAVALKTDAGQWTYRALNEQANQLAYALIEQGVGAEVLVGIATGRSAEMIVALLAVLKSGGGYVPLDAKYPAARIRQMIDDSGAAIVLRQDDVARLAAGRPTTNPPRRATSANVAYVIYTSGSTGTPKGVVVEHAQLRSHVAAIASRCPRTGQQRVLSVTSFSFDVFVEELALSLLTGGTMVLVREGLAISAEEFWSRITGERITALSLTTAYFHYLCTELKEPAGQTLQLVFVGGEALLREPVLQWQRLVGTSAGLFNAYGPTECTIIATVFDLRELGDVAPPIGRALPNYSAHVLDPAGNLCPIGVPGELHLGGNSVARGYLHRDELTVEKFVTIRGERLYKTGDLVRRLADGNLAFLGRTDDQVKVRGFRIELGEVEAALLRAPAVTEAVVVVRGERLIAYVVGEADAARATLEQALPAHMVPSAFVQLDALPLNANGKVDRKALPEPERVEVAYLAPSTETEARLAVLWQETLKLEEPVSVTANFFDLGGHSLLATRIVSAVSEAFDKAIPVRALFEHNTVRSLAAHLEAQGVTAHRAIPVVPRDGALAPSFAQQRLWFIDQLEEGSAQYNIPAALRLRGALDRDALQRTFDTLVGRHEVLRTRFVDGKQVIQAAEPVSIRTLRGELETLAREEALRPFDLRHDLMLRVTLIELGADDHALLITIHHIAADGWSVDVMVREIEALYRGDSLPPLPIQYADYAAWHRQQLQGEAYERQLAYWKAQLADIPAVHALPLDKPRPAQQRFEGGAFVRALDAQLLEQLRGIAQQHNASLFMLLQSAFALLVARWSRSEDVVIGTPVAGREHRALDPLIGFFVNSLVLRTGVNGAQTFEQLLDQARQTALDAYAHQTVPFETLVDELEPERSLSHGALFQLTFSLSQVEARTLNLPGLEVTTLENEVTLTKSDLSLTAVEGASPRLHWEYATSLFERTTIERMADSFEVLLRGIAAAPATRVDALPLLTDPTALLSEGRGERVAVPRELVHELFEQHAARTPDAIALRTGAGQWTYRELNERANQLAHALIERGVQAETLVGIATERSAEMVIAMLGVLKAGGGYVPLDAKYPPSRIAQMLEDSGAPIVLRQDEVAALCADRPVTNPGVRATSANTAYVIYTSGSTGRPKGVVIEHRNVQSYVASIRARYGFGAEERVLSVSSFSFDVFVEETALSLLSGGTMVLVADGLSISAKQFWSLVVSERITVLALSTAYFHYLCTELTSEVAAAVKQTLSLVLVGGEALLREPMLQWRRLIGPDVALFNVYGPTECTVICTAYDMREWDGEGLPSIGRSLPNYSTHVLDAAGALCPIGMPGELYIGGGSVGRGYLHQPELTAEKFVTLHGERLYRTGDLVRRGADHNIAFLGRTDDQVKIRGFRIELGEVEAALLRVPGVGEAVVIAKGEGNEKRLIAYVVGDGVDDLRATLERTLPAHMVPSAFVPLDALPLNANGKIDKKALPEPERVVVAYVAPATPTESRVAALWQQILKLEEPVSVTANFFDLGGHSLLATRIVSAISEGLDKAVPVRAIFEHNTVRSLAAYLDARGQTAHRAIPAAPRTEPLPLSFAQQRLWFIDQLEGGSAQYHMPAALRLSGPLDREALQQAFDAIVERHGILRTTYTADAQTIGAAASLPIRMVDVAPEQLEALIAEETARPFDLASDLMLRVALFRLAAEEHVLVCTMHHIASDAWSVDILIDEVRELYRGETLPPLALQYADFAHWQRAQETAPQLDYWKSQLADLPRVHSLPLDKPRPAQQRFEGGKVERTIDARLAAKLNGLAHGRNASLFMVLQSAFALLVARWSRSNDVAIGSPIAGREHRSLDPLIGFFVNTLVLRTRIEEKQTFGQLLDAARQTALDGFANQSVPFETLVDELKPERSLSHGALFQIMFSLVQGEARSLALPGLEVTPLPRDLGLTKFDLNLTATESGEGLQLHWQYATSLFEQATIERMADSFAVLLQALAEQPATNVYELPLVRETPALRGLTTNEGRERCIHRVFEEQAAKTPDAPAAGALTYRELNQRANRIAHAVTGRGARIGLYAERSADVLAGMLGILKAGLTYVPFEPGNTPERLRHIIDNAGITTVLAQPHLAHNLSAVDVLSFDADGPSHNPAAEVALTDSAYVMYTSGSTGLPKGVEITHAGLIDYLAFASRHYYASHLEGSFVVTSHGFDITIPSLYVPLMHGGHVRFATPGNELQELAANLDRPCLVRMTPMHVAGLLALLPATSNQQRATFVIGGDQFPTSLALDLQQRFPHAQIHNHYGPTETVVGCAMYDVTANLANAKARLPIGRAMENTSLFVLNEAMQPNPVGVPGELHITKGMGGAGVARGYVGQPELTAQKFVMHDGARVYKSGDLVRLLPSGDLEFLGRVDNQIKIRGFRVEPGEIESVLKSLAKDALVTVQGEGEHKQLVAYVVGDVSIDALKARLRAALPEYMVPAGWCLLEAFPLNANGKIDRKALPAIERAAVAFVAPETATETRLAAIWQQILKLDAEPGVTANFFELGGHSLLATRVASAVSAELGKSIPVRTLFEHSTVRTLAAHLDALGASEHHKIEVVPRDQELPLSFAQQRLWFVDQLTGASAQYNMPAAFRLRGRLDHDALQHALDEIVRRHEVLRTNYISELGEGRQVIRAAAAVPITRLAATEATLQEIARAEAQQPFDLANDLMVRAALIALGENDHVLLFTTHHIATDGWSNALLAQEFTALYRGDALPELPVQYADFASWQRNWLTGDVLEAQLAYWKTQLAGAPPVHSLPLDKPRPTLQGSAGDRYVQNLDRALHAGLNALARGENASLYMVLQSALALLVGRWSNETDVVIGNTIAGRTHQDVEALIGFFVNNVVLRTDLASASSFRDLVARVKQTSLEAHANQDIPFEMLVEELKVERSLAHAPLVQLVFTFRNNERAEVSLPDLELEPLGDSLGSSRFDIELLVTEHADRLELAWGYSTDLFERTTIERLGESFETLLRNAIAAPETHIEQLGIVSDADRARRASWQPADLPFPADLCVHELFEQRAAETPDAVAIVFDGEELTYGELNATANQLARYLVDKNVKPDARVALCTERSFDMVVGMLAILKAGAGYVPIDPQYPEERIEQILTDSGVSMILTQAELLELNPMFNDYAALPIDGGFRDVLLARYSTENLGATATARNLAYVIYTSGSTGTPKGAMIEHRSVVRLVINNHYVPLSAETRILQASTSAFDAATFEIWGALLNGGRLILYPESRIDLGAINRQIEQHGVNTFFVTTGLFDQWSYQLPRRDCLRWILTGGDVTSPASVQRVYEALPGVHISNIYGPTENTTFSTYFPIARDADFAQSLPIGNKINGTSLHVLDRARQELPAGAIGELYCGGPGLARGYLGQPALTGEKFITIDEQRLYRTGDLVRMLPGGDLAFLGRADNQVKIRGFRIELGEIEAKLLLVPGVRDAFVVAKGDRTNKYLAAYLVAEEEVDWRVALRQTLPEHMIPTAFVRMSALPLNANGKVDQKALPEPERLAQAAYIAPTSQSEVMIAAIWADILKLDGKVSANADFFDLGGNSLTLLRVKAHVESAFGIEVPTRLFFEYPTVTGIALATELLRSKSATAALGDEVEMEVGEL